MAVGVPDDIAYDTFYKYDEKDTDCIPMTISTYIRQKEWSSPYMYGDWYEQDKEAMSKARSARFEHGESPSF